MQILTVDDNEAFRSALCAWLASLGLVVLTAASFEEACERMRAHPDIGLVFLDLIMPPDDAMATLAKLPRLREINPRATIVILTGSMDEKVKEISRTLADGFLHKSRLLGQSDLWLAIQEALERNERGGHGLVEGSGMLLGIVTGLLKP